MESIDRFAARMQDLWREPLPDAERWERVRVLMPVLLEDPELRRAAAGWDDTNGDGYTTTTNLLLYEDPQFGFVINALVKAEGGEVRPHDHAHTWTAYGVIEGIEKVLRYDLVAGDRESDRAELRLARESVVAPGSVDVIGPYETHAEVAASGRTVAVIVRSQRVGIALHAIHDLKTGAVERRVGPAQVPVRL